MGFLCCFGFADKDAEAPRPAHIPNAPPVSVVERTWQEDDSWKTQLSATSKDNDQESMPQRVRRYIDTLYPQCAKAGSTEDMGESRYRLTDGTCSPYTSREILVLDNDFTGVIYSAVLIVNLPSDADLTPGKWLDTPEMEEAKAHILLMLTGVEAENVNVNVKHTIARIFVGGDALWCKFHPDNTKPSISDLSSDPPREFKKSNDELAKVMRKATGVPVGMFRSVAFEKALQGLYESYPGCTVWDEGPLLFNVAGKPFTEPTRLLVARVFDTRLEKDMVPDEEIEATVYRVNRVGIEPGQAQPWKLLQNRNPRKNYGSIVAVTLFVAIPLTEVWPKVGTYAKSSAMKAAKAAAVELLENWNRQGRFERCNLTIWMGADHLRVKFISERFGSLTALKDKKQEDQAADTRAAEYPSLEPFFVALKQEEEHELFKSEVQFQAIKNLIRQRAEQDPERYRVIAPQIALMTAHHFLEANYPGCDVSDEGEFPVTLDGEPTTICDTRFVVAKDPKKESNNVIAALHLVPLPGGESMSWTEVQDKVWLDTVEMKGAEEALLAVLKKWYKEGRLAEDCMAQVIMGTDATIYRFVDGERFEDYPEERQKQFKWQ